MKITKKLVSLIGGIVLALNVTTARAETLSGKVYDALTSQTVNSIPVHLDESWNYTNRNGDYSFDVPVGMHHFKVSDNVTRYFNFEEDINVTTDTQKNVWMIPVKNVDTSYYPDFLAKLKYLTYSDGRTPSGNTKINRWHNEFIPIKIWYYEEQADQLYGQENATKYFDGCDSAIQQWEAKSGINLFQRVNENPEDGVELDYTDSMSRVSTLSTLEDFTPKKKRLYISNTEYLYPATEIVRLYEHELGHCIGGFSHSLDPNDIMYQPTTSTAQTISQNEADILRIIYTLPNFTDMAHYNNTKSRNSVKNWNLYQ